MKARCRAGLKRCGQKGRRKNHELQPPFDQTPNIENPTIQKTNANNKPRLLTYKCLNQRTFQDIPQAIDTLTLDPKGKRGSKERRDQGSRRSNTLLFSRTSSGLLQKPLKSSLVESPKVCLGAYKVAVLSPILHPPLLAQGMAHVD